MQQQDNANNIVISFTDIHNDTRLIEINRTNMYLNNQIRKYVEKIKEIVTGQPEFIDGSKNICVSLLDDNQTKTEVIISNINSTSLLSKQVPMKEEVEINGMQIFNLLEKTNQAFSHMLFQKGIPRK